ncbi:MAG: hypothetical protein L0Y36_05585 [Planctomycetales bacterium]|nr:hypothetical protein [Planctomycetales bacterium]
MPQTPREIVEKALRFEYPERIPRHLWVLPWAQNNYPQELKVIQQKYPDDFVAAPDVYRKSPLVNGDPYQIGKYTDEWGCTFENLQQGVIGEVKNPIIPDLSDLSGLVPPYKILPDNPGKARDIVNKFCDQTDRFVLTPCFPRPWERMQFLHGSVNSMMDIMTPETDAKQLLDKIHEFYMKELEFWVSTNIDGIMFMDDWGSQMNLLIPPVIWQDIFKPLYKDYCDIAHSKGKFAFMHSDGNIIEIYPYLIEVGVDALNSQLFCMDMEKLAVIAKRKITFWGEIDRQHILPGENIDAIRQAVRKVAKNLYDPAGGVIAQMEFGPGTKPQNVEAVFIEWEKIQQSHPQ